jgi:DNA polymerase (family 10)
VDIFPSGALALSDEALEELDCVVASVHSRFRDTSQQTTERIIRALRGGRVHVLGHPSGRLIGARDPYAYDLEAVLEVAREQGVALEVNAQPDRLDLTDHACRVAKQMGVPVVINSDAHHPRQLENLRYGVWVARRGGLEARDVLNTLPVEELRRRFKRHRPWAPGWAPEPEAPSAH